MQWEWENNLCVLLSLEFFATSEHIQNVTQPLILHLRDGDEETPSNSTREGAWLLILKIELGWAVKCSSGAQEELYQIPCQVMSLVLS